jgi:hypothetical protein
MSKRTERDDMSADLINREAKAPAKEKTLMDRQAADLATPSRLTADG